MTKVLKEDLERGWLSKERGDGREYFMNSFLIFTNQEVEWSGSEASFERAILWRMLYGNKVIIPNKDSCLRWILAVAPKEPAMKRTKHSGVFWWSFIRLWRQFLWCCLRADISDSKRLSEAIPESKTGRAYTDWTLKDTAGLAFWFLARPAGRTEKSALI